MVPKAIALALVLFMAGCAHNPPVSDPRSVWCGQNQPFRLPDVMIAMMSRGEREAVLSHNLKGAEWCGWKP